MLEKHHFSHAIWTELTSVYRYQKKSLHNLIYFFPAIVLYIVCFAGILVLFLRSSYGIFLHVRPIPVFLPKPVSYPLLQNKIQPNVTADSVVVMDADSSVIIYQKNPSLRLSPASTTKLITSLVGIDYFGLNDELTIQTATVEGTVVGFPLGRKVTFKNLLYGMLLPSGNDAALAVSENYPGQETAFVFAMNKKAQEIGLIHSHFNDPAGLTDDETYTTVQDLARLASIFLKNQTLNNIVKTKSAILTDTNGDKFPVENLNKLLGWHNVDGVKTGHTEGAGDVLVTSLKKDGHRIIVVVMRSSDRFLDTITLVNSIVDSMKYLSIYP